MTSDKLWLTFFSATVYNVLPKKTTHINNTVKHYKLTPAVFLQSKTHVHVQMFNTIYALYDQPANK